MCRARCYTPAAFFNDTWPTLTTFHLRDEVRDAFQRQHIHLKPIGLSDEEWLQYRPAEELLKDLIALAEEGKLEALTWEDIVKSALLVSVFIPIPPIESISLAARIVIWSGLGAVKGGAATAALPHASKMIRHIAEFFSGKPSERRVQLLRDFSDLMLLKLEADTTTRLLVAAGDLLLATGVNELTIESHPQLTLANEQGATSKLLKND